MILLCINFQSTLMYNHFVIVCHFARLSGNILKVYAANSTCIFLDLGAT